MVHFLLLNYTVMTRQIGRPRWSKYNKFLYFSFSVQNFATRNAPAINVEM